jgi:hypothetical protein
MRKLIKKILIEETEDLDKGVLNFLKRRVNVKKTQIGDDENPIMVTNVFFNVEGEYYGFNSFASKKEQVRKILEMLSETNLFSLEHFNPNILNTERQRVIKTIRHFINSLDLN